MIDQTEIQELAEAVTADQETANLTVLMGGLAIGHQKKDRWQSVFLTGIPNHNLQMSVFRLNADGSEGQPQLIDIENNDPISIVPQGVQYWTSHDQDRGRWDLRNLVDFTDLHGGPVQFERPEKMTLTRVEAFGGHGYTATMAQDDGRPNYWFVRKGTTVQSPQKRYLGTWLGINYKLPAGRSVEIRGRSGRLHSSIVNDHYRVVIAITNNCRRIDGCSEELDFSYYYRESGHDEKGIIAETPFELHVDAQELDQSAHIVPTVGDRIACNKMMISDLGGLSSLFDLEG